MTRPGVGFAWRLRGFCGQTDPDAFHPAPGTSIAVQRRVCLPCPVRTTCLDWALGVHGNPPERDGIWGGKSKTEREQMRASMGLQAPTSNGRREAS